jgi:hypothetical protein
VIGSFLNFLKGDKKEKEDQVQKRMELGAHNAIGR